MEGGMTPVFFALTVLATAVGALFADEIRTWIDCLRPRRQLDVRLRAIIQPHEYLDFRLEVFIEVENKSASDRDVSITYQPVADRASDRRVDVQMWFAGGFGRVCSFESLEREVNQPHLIKPQGHARICRIEARTPGLRRVRVRRKEVERVSRLMEIRRVQIQKLDEWACSLDLPRILGPVAWSINLILGHNRLPDDAAERGKAEAKSEPVLDFPSARFQQARRRWGMMTDAARSEWEEVFRSYSSDEEFKEFCRLMDPPKLIRDVDLIGTRSAISRR